MLLEKYNLYIPQSARICESHLLLDVWHILLQNANIFTNFTASLIDDILFILKSEKTIFNFENVSDMSNILCHYWTGLTVANFLNLFY